ncbi:hypothetical protein RAS12_30735 (plasmid) [Achromobacter seleniivolatilans]|uniref:DUF4288 domain-containing protein n=1 Tax=Achromobacter seleniivolatilans TaxID=3047478 RepID=A0ABY9MAJ6_9BURK|nr:hypothetical protein [Achromobacter sp. R39]WMD24011.1 hypothetical protein RAS12_30735 [Achromobacter sp. R39]
MSHSITLYCVETKQAVHAAEQSSSWFRGPDYAVVLGAFCLAHVGRELKTTYDLDSVVDNSLDYDVWTAENAVERYAAIEGEELEHLESRLVFPYL